VPSNEEITLFEFSRTLRRAMGVIGFSHPSGAFSDEGNQLTDYFEKYVARRMESLADPYAVPIGAEDPFEYRGVPYTERRTVKAKPKWVGAIPPSPIDDD
jgi:hypothetical protein